MEYIPSIITALATVSLAVITFFYILKIKETIKEMQKQNCEIKKQREESNIPLVKFYKHTEYLSPGNQKASYYVAKNIGKGPALNCHYYIDENVNDYKIISGINLGVQEIAELNGIDDEIFKNNNITLCYQDIYKNKFSARQVKNFRFEFYPLLNKYIYE